MEKERFTPSGIRLRQHSARPGRYHWLLLPGGPGLGSQSLQGLADCLAVPGTVWLVDLPGDGDNRLQTAPACYQNWPGILAEVPAQLQDCVFIGHSTGGMYLLSVPGIESQLAGLVLISSAPDASWREHFGQMAAQHEPAGMAGAMAQFNRQPDDQGLAALTMACAEWSFTPAGLAAGQQLLSGLPYNLAAVQWSDQHFDDQYQARWWPTRLPTMIVSGMEDRVVAQQCWEDSRYQGDNVRYCQIAAAGHFPWVEQAPAVRQAFADFAVNDLP